MAKKDMTLKEFKVAKGGLEQQMLASLRAFEEVHGVRITGIRMDHHSIMDPTGEVSLPSVTHFELSIEV